MSATVAVAMSTTANELASCRVTKAVDPSGETAMYSGSTSAAVSLPGNRRTPLACSSASRPLNAVKVAVSTTGEATPDEISMMLTEPSGSMPSSGSPSLATRTFWPSGVKVSMSGSAPTSTLFSKVPSVSKNSTWPGSVTGSAGTATATIPFFTATLVGARFSKGAGNDRENSLVGLAGSAMLTTSTVLSDPLVMNRRCVAGSWATISAPPSSKTPVR